MLQYTQKDKLDMKGRNPQSNHGNRLSPASWPFRSSSSHGSPAFYPLNLLNVILQDVQVVTFGPSLIQCNLGKKHYKKKRHNRREGLFCSLGRVVIAAFAFLETSSHSGPLISEVWNQCDQKGREMSRRAAITNTCSRHHPNALAPKAYLKKKRGLLFLKLLFFSA